MLRLSGLISAPKNEPYATEKIELAYNQKKDTAIRLDRVEYTARDWLPVPIEVGVFYGKNVNQIPSMQFSWASAIMGRMDYFQADIQPFDPLIVTAESFFVYIYRKDLSAQDLVHYCIYYDEITLTDIQTITMNRAGGFSTYSALFKQ
jgi:hypothetical protein